VLLAIHLSGPHAKVRSGRQPRLLLALALAQLPGWPQSNADGKGGLVANGTVPNSCEPFAGNQFEVSATGKKAGSPHCRWSGRAGSGRAFLSAGDIRKASFTMAGAAVPIVQPFRAGC
jgi:hypothetical protein